MFLFLRLALFVSLLLCLSSCTDGLSSDEENSLLVRKTEDFKITGDGSADEWQTSRWVQIPQRTSAKKTRETKAKLLYSETGMYFLFQCEDSVLSSTMNADFMDLWNEDVVEVFLWTDENHPVYFEYELSPLDFELPLLIYNDSGNLLSWQPFPLFYGDDRKPDHATSVQGGEKKSKALVNSWMAEFFIPYKLLRPLDNIPPQSGTKWRANLYRIDYDNGEELWSWKLTSGNFHEYEKFGTLQFE